MFGCFKRHHRGKGKQGMGRGGQGQPETGCRQRGGGRGRRGERSFQMFRREETPAGSTTLSAGATCPLCKNHCLLSEPGCPKGEALAESLSRPH